MSTWARIGIGAGLALFTLVCMLLAMRLAGPVTHKANFGTLEYEISPSFSGKAQIFIPLAGWQLEAPVFDAPFAFKAEPRSVDPKGVHSISKGVKPFLRKAKHDVKHGAILAYVRSFLIGLAGGLVAALAIFLYFTASRVRRRTAILAGAGSFALALLLTLGSSLWVWQSLDIKALKRPTVTQGIGAKAIDKALRRLRDDANLGMVMQDLAPLVIAELTRRIKESGGR